MQLLKEMSCKASTALEAPNLCFFNRILNRNELLSFQSSGGPKSALFLMQLLIVMRTGRAQKRTEENRRAQKRTEESRREQKRTEENRRAQKRTAANRRKQKRAGENRREQKRAEENRRERWVVYCIVLYCIALYCIELYCVQSSFRPPLQSSLRARSGILQRSFENSFRDPLHRSLRFP